MRSSGKLVNTSRKSLGKKRVPLSTLSDKLYVQYGQASVKPVLFPHFHPLFTQYFSPLKIGAPPLAEHYFYPVSTGPINTPTE